jgi:hypothetical protein
MLKNAQNVSDPDDISRLEGLLGDFDTVDDGWSAASESREHDSVAFEV